MKKIKISISGEIDPKFWAILPVLAIGKRPTEEENANICEYYLSLGWLCGMVSIFVESIGEVEE